MRPYPLTPQVMNGTGALRQFVPRVARHSSRATFGYWPARQSLNDSPFAHHAASEKKHLRPYALPLKRPTHPRCYGEGSRISYRQSCAMPLRSRRRVGGGDVRYLGEIDTTEAATRKLDAKLRPNTRQLTFCYEAGSTGYGLYRLIRKLGEDRIVAAPWLSPEKPGDRVKTNRRDAVAYRNFQVEGPGTASV